MQLIGTIVILTYAIIAGNWQDYIYQFQTRSFVHLISIDFGLMCLIFPITSLFEDDMARRAFKDARIFWIGKLLPLFGPLLYLCIRPSLPAERQKEAL